MLWRFFRKSGFQPMEWLIGVLIALVAAIITVVRVSDLSVYSADNTRKRAELHRAIVKNDPPGDGTWRDSGANNVNVRVAVVWVAEHLSRMTGKSTDFIYRAIDLASLFAALLCLQALLKHWFSPVEAILGLLLFCMLLPLTALDHYFHPWDRPMSGSSMQKRSEEHTSELQSLTNLVCRLLLEKKQNIRSSSRLVKPQT